MHHVISIRRNALAGALAIALLSPLSAFAQTTGTADQSQTQDTTSKSVTLQKVVVTGSLIARSEVEGPAPVTTVTGEQIKAQGYTTLYEFMNSVTQSGVSQTAPSWGSTSVNARQLNLRNLGSGHSLLLVNGHRVVDYPQPANGQSNFQNYNNIPTGMIDRVEILASGASSIYGSDAIAGVVNVILKKSYQGDDLQVTGGGATRGGRRYADFSLTGGRAGDHWNIVYNLEHTNRTALWGRDRPYTDSEADAGFGTWDQNARMFGYKTYDALSLYDVNGNYIAPPGGACGQFPNFNLRHQQTVGTSGKTVTGPVTDYGYYCTQPNLFRNWVLTPGLISNDGYISGEYDFGNNLQAYGSVGMWDTNGISNTQLPFLYPMGGLPGSFYDQTSGQVISNYFRQLTRAEIGSDGNTHDHEQNWDIHAGLRGTVLDNRFHWDLNLGTSKYIVHEDYTGLNEQGMFNFFFGPQQGTTTVGGNNYPIYAVNQGRYWNPITPAQYATFGVSGRNSAVSWMDQASLNVNGDLFNTWVGQPIGFAAVLEANHEGYRLSPDARGNTTSFGDPFQDNNTGGGTRTRFSLGTEFRVPLLSTLTWTISGRVDKYNDASIANTAKTWGTGIEWRPYDGLLLRGSYGTNFHAPDMQAIYQTNSTMPVGIYRDPYQCIQAGDTTCQSVQHTTYFTQHSGGSRNLVPETGHSWTYGFVWDIPGADGLSVSADYWHMGIDNAISYVSQDTLLVDEAGCRTGKQFDGSPYVAHVQGSPYCQLAIRDVARDGNGNITDVYVGPINESSLYVSGIDAELKYHFETSDWGRFLFDINYTDNLSYKERTLASDPLLNTRYQHVASKVTGTAEWSKGPWKVTLYGQRAGSIRANNFGGCEKLANGITPSQGDPACIPYYGHIAPWITWSTAVSYHFNDRLKLSLNVSNIFDKVGSIPYYSGGFEFIPTLQGATYNGREIFMTLNYKLD
ncbi:MAG TPA: TonB-dependent receptor [Rhodanobacter sp.]|nr:TonB-dependent receptor [Rhodanobacter sp.]